MDRLTVYTAGHPAAAHVVCSRLQTAGFDASVEGESAALNSEVFIEIRVQVPAAQAREAREFIQASEENAR